MSFKRVTVRLVYAPMSPSAIKIPSQLLGSSSITKEVRKVHPICKSFPPEEPNHSTAGGRRVTGRKGEREKAAGKCLSVSPSPFLPFFFRLPAGTRRRSTLDAQI